jgi:putative membrane protein insertion efficiency factor
MKYLAITLIKFYQRFLSPLLSQLLGTRMICRFSPTCSTYAIEVISKYGILRGSLLAGTRLLACQPLSKQS